MIFTAKELSDFYGPWNPAKIALIRKYCREESGCSKVIQFLMSAMDVIEKVQVECTK